jgi:glutamate racemase
MQIPSGGVFFFDSGIGGLNVLSACRKVLPNIPFYYFGDNLNAPYGNKSPLEIKKLVFNAFKQVETLSPVCAVLACNTATAVCAEDLRKKYSFPIIGVEPAPIPALKTAKSVGVLSTKATYQSARFSRLLTQARSSYPSATITPVACDNLAGEIEKHILGLEYDYTPLLPPINADAIVLGCTHYLYIKKQIHGFYSAPVFDGNEGVANRLKNIILTKIRDKQPLATPFLNCQKNAQIYFLGYSNGYNEQVYEQMFAKTNDF